MPRPTSEDNRPIAIGAHPSVGEYATSQSDSTRSDDDSESVGEHVGSSSSPDSGTRSQKSSLVLIILAGLTAIVALLAFLFGDNIVSRLYNVETTVDVRDKGESVPPEVEGMRFHSTYSFKKSPLVHPKIIGDLVGEISDAGDQVVAINLLDAQDSNRYSGEVRVVPKTDPQVSDWPWIYSANQVLSLSDIPNDQYGIEFDAYRYIGSTQSGLDMLHTKWSGGGAGVFSWLIFVHIEKDSGVDYPLWSDVAPSRDGAAEPEPRDRELLRITGLIPLGDRWYGTVEIVGDDIVIRGRDLDERCRFGGVTAMEAVEMKQMMDIPCKQGEANIPPPARVYKAPERP